MNKDSRTPIDRIVRAWKNEYGIKRTGEKGSEYVIIKTSPENLRILAQTMIDAGYSFEEIDDYRISAKIADICWRDDKIIKMSGPEIVKAKLSLTRDWNEVLARPEFSGIVMSKVEPDTMPVEEKKEPKPEKLPEIDPSDRIKIDTTGFIEPVWDLDFLAKLGVDPPSEDE